MSRTESGIDTASLEPEIWYLGAAIYYLYRHFSSVPTEGLQELLNTMREISEYYVEKEHYMSSIPQLPKCERKQIVIKGKTTRPIFTIYDIDSEE